MFVAQGTYGGWFHVYSFTFLAGVLVPWGVSLLVTHRRQIPLWPIEFGLVILIVPALIMASIFGKIRAIGQIGIIDLIAFWQPGMAIWGGLIGGGIVGWGWIFFCAKRLKISVWVFIDLTLPHFLLGQAIGRWGNFFNHELLGLPTTRDHLGWLPPFIRDNLFKWYYPDPIPDHFRPHQAIGHHGGGVGPGQFSQVQYYQPLFLFESIADVGLWIVIVFLLPRIWKTIGCIRWRRQHHQVILVNDFYHELYFQITPASHTLQQLQRFKRNHHQLNKKSNNSFGGKVKIKFHQWWRSWCHRWLVTSPQLEELHNPDQIPVLRSGMVGLSYVMGYAIVRLILNFQRYSQTPTQHLWVYLVLSLLVAVVFGCQFLVQVISPLRLRRVGWLYEKQY